MTGLFLTVLRLSAEAALVAAVVMLLRLLLADRMPKSVMPFLWAAVPLRAALPWHLPRLLPQYAPPELLPKGILPPMETAGFGAAPAVMRAATAADFAAWIWLTVAALLLIGMAALYLRAGRRIRGAVPAAHMDAPALSGKRIPVYISDAVPSPLVWGILRPRIMLPPGCGEGGALKLILAHERIHIRRRDYLLKPLALILVAAHWFNPVLWLAFWLWSRDMELSCDERTVRETGDAAAYANALLDMAVRQNGLLQCGFAAGSRGVGKRIRAVLRKRRIRRWPAACAALATCCALLCAFTGAEQATAETLSQPGTRAAEPAAGAEGAGQAEGLVETGMAWPVQDLSVVSEKYGPRFDGEAFHTGVDLTGEDAEGKAVFAAADGVVTHVVDDDTPGYGYGKYIIVDHGGGIATLYAHCGKLLAAAGEPVKRGQVIAEAGSTGFVTEPHLHFEVRVNHVTTDPMLWLQAGGRGDRQRAVKWSRETDEGGHLVLEAKPQSENS